MLTAGFVVAAWFYYVRVLYDGQTSFPQNTFLVNPSQRFHDFIDTSEMARTIDPYRSKMAIYPPFCFLAMAPFFAFKGWIAYTLYFVVFLALTAKVLVSQLRRLVSRLAFVDVLALIAMAYPVLMVLDRGNPEGLVFLFLWKFVDDYRSRPGRSAFFLACAIAMKIFPALFMIIPLADKRYKLARDSLGWVALLTVLSLFVFKSSPLESMRLFLENVSHVSLEAMVRPAHLIHGVSLQAMARVIASPWWPGLVTGDSELIMPFLRVYLVISAILGVAMAAWAWAEKETWKRSFILVSATLLLPTVSFGYRLILLYVPLLLFISASGKFRFDRAYSVLFGLLLTPTAYFVITWEITSVTIVIPALLMVFLGMLACERLASGRASAVS